MMNKKGIKVFLAAVIISLVMAYLPVQTATKDKICLNETKISLNVGQKKKLTLIKNKKNVTKKIKWSSKNKNKVSVNKKGVVRALRSGQTKITAKYHGKKYSEEIGIPISNSNLVLPCGICSRYEADE